MGGGPIAEQRVVYPCSHVCIEPRIPEQAGREGRQRGAAYHGQAVLEGEGGGGHARESLRHTTEGSAWRSVGRVAEGVWEGSGEYGRALRDSPCKVGGAPTAYPSLAAAVVAHSWHGWVAHRLPAVSNHARGSLGDDDRVTVTIRSSVL